MMLCQLSVPLLLSKYRIFSLSLKIRVLCCRDEGFYRAGSEE